MDRLAGIAGVAGEFLFMVDSMKQFHDCWSGGVCPSILGGSSGVIDANGFDTGAGEYMVS
ncbi:hypothetical protein GCM10027589_00350 [Actinocorallia lasiicapitis]